MKRILPVVLMMALLLSLFTLPAYAEGEDVILTITPDVTSVDTTGTTAEVTYTIAITVKEDTVKIGGIQFELVPPTGMTLATTGHTYPNRPQLHYDETDRPEGAFEIFGYTAGTKKFIASNTIEARALNQSITLMTIKATIDANKTGELTLTAKDVEFAKVAGESEKWTHAVSPTPVAAYIKLTGEQAVTLSGAPTKGGTVSDITVNSKPANTTAAIAWFTGGGSTAFSETTFAANTAYTAQITLTPDAGYQFAADATYALDSATVTPTDGADDGAKVLTKTFAATASKDTPAINTAPTASAITYGQTLNDSTLSSGAASVAGSFAWQTDSTAPQVSDSNTTEYTVVFTPSNTGNYSTATCKVKLAVNPKGLIDVAIGDISDLEYTGSQITPTPVVTSTQTVGGYTLVKDTDYTVSYGTNINKGTGGGSVTVTAKEGSNYTFTPAVTKTFNIVAQAGNIVIGNPGVITYDGAAVEAGTSGKDLNYTYTGDGTVTVKWYADANKDGIADGTALGSAPINVGTYLIGVSATAGSNYGAVTEQFKQFTISPATIPDSVKTAITGYSAAYDKNAHNAVVIGSDASSYTVKFSDTQSGTYNAANPQITNVSDSKTVWVEISKDNYTTVTKSVSAAITPKTLTIDGATITGKDYDGAATLATSAVTAVTLTGDLDSMTLGTDFEVTAASYTNFYVGTTQPTSITVALKNTDKANNYQISSATYISATAAITAATQTLTSGCTTEGAAYSLTKGGSTVDLTTLVSGAAGALSFAITSGDDFASLQADNKTLKSNATAGTVKITVSAAAYNAGGTADNEYAAASNLDIFVKVVDKESAPLDVTQTGCIFGETLADPTYTGHSGTVTITYSGTPYVGGSYSNTAKPTQAGTYTVTVKEETTTHIYTGTDNFTIAKKSISGTTVNLASGTLTYNATEQTQGVASVQVGSATVPAGDYSVTNNTRTNAGSGELTVTITKDASNYTGSVIKAFTIAKKSITPTITVTGTYTFTDSALTPTYTVQDGSTALAATDYTAEVSDNINAGNGKITVKEKSGGNYTFTAKDQTFPIAKAAYGDKTGTSSAKYGATGTLDISSLLAPGYELGTVSTTDGNSILSGSPSVAGTTLSYTLVNDPAKVGQTATITIPITSSTNHEAYDITVTVTVTDKAAQSSFAFTSGSQSKTYGDADFTVAATGQVPGSTVSYVSSDTAVATVDASTGVVTILKSGSAVITATAAATADYAEATVTCNLTVNKAALTVRPKSFSIYVNEPMPTPVVEYVGLIAGDTVTPTSGTLDMRVNNADNSGPLAGTATAGTYKIVFTDSPGFDSDKYTFTIDDGKLTISRKSSGGGGSGGGGGGASPLTVPVSGEDTARVSVALSGDKATIAITDEQLDDVLGSGADEVTIDVSSLSRVTEVVVPDDVIDKIVAEGDTGLTIQTDTATVTLDAETLETVAGVDGDLQLKIIAVTYSSLDGRQQSLLGQDVIVLDLQLYKGDTPISDFKGGTATVRIPYEGEPVESMIVWRMATDAAGNVSLEPIQVTIDRATNSYVFTTDQFSQYVLAHFPFNDVDGDKWYYENVVYAYMNELFQGTGATTFAPEVTMSRAMLVTVLWRMEGQPAANAAGGFTDLTQDWYKGAVNWAAAKGIVQGYSDTEFGPDDTVTREQMAAVLYRYAGTKGYNVTATTSLTGYNDAASVSDWATDALSWATGAKLVQGDGANLLPQDGAQRAQVAAILQRFADNVK